MNTQIASLILSRIRAANFPWIEKNAGLVRQVSTKVKGKQEVLPIAADVLGSADCEPSAIDHLLPDTRYRSILFIECSQFPTRKSESIGSPSWTATYRIVVWMDCSKLGGGAGCGDVAYENLVTTLDLPMFDSGLFRGVVFRVVGGGPARGKDIFGKYTLNEERSQYLHYPFDFFALDLQVDFAVPKGCENELAEDNVNCWAPSSSDAGVITPTCPPVRTCDTPTEGDVLTHVGGATVWAPPSGGGGGSFSGVVSLTVNAGETIGGHRVVMIDGSDAVYFDPTDTNNAGKMLGVSTAAASIGNDVDITTEGPVVNSGWGLTPGAVYFAIASGLLSTTPVTTGICQRIGVALDANTLNVHLSEPVTLI